MEPNRYVLRGTSLAQLGARALAEHGPRARIVSAERILQGGIRGFLARESFEATVEVPRDPERTLLPPPPSQGEADSRRRRRALEQRRRGDSELAEDAAEDLDEGFARMMDELWLASRQGASPADPAATPQVPAAVSASAGSGSAGSAASGSADVPAEKRADVPAEKPVEAPRPLGAPGALIVIACLGVDEATALAAFAETSGFGALGDPLLLGEVDVAGRSLREARQVMLRARAEAVVTEVPVLATCTLRFPPADQRSGAEAPMVMEADQLWAAVDLRRKPEDIRHWLRVIEESRPIDGLVLTCDEETLTPETGHHLGWPVSARMNRC